MPVVVSDEEGTSQVGKAFGEDAAACSDAGPHPARAAPKNASTGTGGGSGDGSACAATAAAAASAIARAPPPAAARRAQRKSRPPSMATHHRETVTQRAAEVAPTMRIGLTIWRMALGASSEMPKSASDHAIAAAE